MSKNGSKPAESAPKKAEEVKAEEPKFALEKLREHAFKLFGVDECTFIGATAELAEDTLYSVKEIKTVIEEWQKKEVK